LQGALYSIGKVLGQGGFGITYLGSDSGLKRAVATKEFFPQVQGCSRDGATVQPGGMITHLEYRQEKGDYSKVTGLSHHAALALCRVLVV
jgi:serine/threonine protein kinase